MAPINIEVQNMRGKGIAPPPPISAKGFFVKNGTTAGTAIGFVNQHLRKFTKQIVEIDLGKCPTCFLGGHVAALCQFFQNFRYMTISNRKSEMFNFQQRQKVHVKKFVKMYLDTKKIIKFIIKSFYKNDNKIPQCLFCNQFCKNIPIVLTTCELLPTIDHISVNCVLVILRKFPP